MVFYIQQPPNGLFKTPRNDTCLDRGDSFSCRMSEAAGTPGSFACDSRWAQGSCSLRRDNEAHPIPTKWQGQARQECSCSLRQGHEAPAISSKGKAQGVSDSRGSGRRLQGSPVTEHRVPFMYRVTNVDVPLAEDPGKDNISVHDALLDAVAVKIRCQKGSLDGAGVQVVRKSFDARKEPLFVYTVHIPSHSILRAFQISQVPPRKAKLVLSKLTPVSEPAVRQTGGIPAPNRARIERGSGVFEAPQIPSRTFIGSSSDGNASDLDGAYDLSGSGSANAAGFVTKQGHVVGLSPKQRGRGGTTVVVGSGPAGLFAALGLAEAGERVVVVERGQAVEVRGRDIGAFAHRRLLDPNSNFCFGEGGAGTWSDGKLTTRIGKNSGDVLEVLRALVAFGAPERILVDGKPHLGTDRLVHILKGFRQRLLALGAEIRFGCVMRDLVVESGRVTGVVVGPAEANEPHSRGPGLKQSGEAGTVIHADRVVLAVGHSARDVYGILLKHDVQLSAKDFAVGLRVEHPQELINDIQYGHLMDRDAVERAVLRGRGKMPVADYSLAEEVDVTWEDREESWVQEQATAAGGAERRGSARRGCYSFCMCPGGQVVSTATSEWELCINGMSFSARSSKWANSALVTTVTANDFAPFIPDYGPLAGVAFQCAVEREAALRGGGNYVVPVQRVTDFLEERYSAGTLPSSSYRLGVQPSRLDQLFLPHITKALQNALLLFDRRLPGFITDQALLHGAETRTSAPVRVERNLETFESCSLRGLYPIGEGAGYAGGIVSAAVDGLKVAKVILRNQLTARMIVG